MIDIPNTPYRISGSEILAPDGGAISQEEFVQKVEKGEISLTENSLQVISSHFGPDLAQSLQLASGRTPGGVGASMDDICGAGERGVNLFEVMLLMHEATQKMREAEGRIRDSQVDAQINALNEAASAAHEAAYVRMIAGCVTGTMSIASGALSVKGALAGKAELTSGLASADDAVRDAASTAAKTVADRFSGFASLAEGSGKLGGALTEYFGAANQEEKSKRLDASAKAHEIEASKSRDALDTIRDVNAKVRETLQAIASAESDAAKSVNRM